MEKKYIKKVSKDNNQTSKAPIKKINPKNQKDYKEFNNNDSQKVFDYFNKILMELDKKSPKMNKIYFDCEIVISAIKKSGTNKKLFEILLTVVNKLIELQMHKIAYNFYKCFLSINFLLLNTYNQQFQAYWKPIKYFYAKCWLNIYEQMLIHEYPEVQKLPIKQIRQDLLKNYNSTKIENEHLGILKILLEKQEKLKEKLNQIKLKEKELKEQRKPKYLKIKADSEILLEEDFKQMQINPTREELMADQHSPQLIEIPLKGGFSSFNRYLETHFRLLREDFIWEFRSGVIQFIDDQIKKKQNQKTTKNTQVYVYWDCYTSGYFASKGFYGLGFKIYSSVPENSYKFWQNTKKLKYGSMIIFSIDNFQDTFYLGVIKRQDGEKNDELQKKHGYIEIFIEILNNTNPLMLQTQLSDNTITILESKAYYESYYHILKCLKGMDFMQFQDQIVFLDKYNLETPQYINQIKNLDQKRKQFIAQNSFDDSQTQAFELALNNNIALIQGPPGTGKTYVGVQIIKFLLENFDVINKPIILTCFTNHALDQFLLAISEYTKQIVRLGGRTKNENLKQFTLWEWQDKLKGQKNKDEKSRFIQQRFHEEQNNNKELVKEFNNFLQNKQLNAFIPVFLDSQLQTLSQFMKEESYQNLENFLKEIKDRYESQLKTFITEDNYLLQNGLSLDYLEFYIKQVQFIRSPWFFYMLKYLDFEFILVMFQEYQETRYVSKQEKQQIQVKTKKKQLNNFQILEDYDNSIDQNAVETLQAEIIENNKIDKQIKNKFKKYISFFLQNVNLLDESFQEPESDEDDIFYKLDLEDENIKDLKQKIEKFAQNLDNKILDEIHSLLAGFDIEFGQIADYINNQVQYWQSIKCQAKIKNIVDLYYDDQEINEEMLTLLNDLIKHKNKFSIMTRIERFKQLQGLVQLDTTMQNNHKDTVLEIADIRLKETYKLYLVQLTSEYKINVGLFESIVSLLENLLITKEFAQKLLQQLKLNETNKLELSLKSQKQDLVDELINTPEKDQCLKIMDQLITVLEKYKKIDNDISKKELSEKYDSKYIQLKQQLLSLQKKPQKLDDSDNEFENEEDAYQEQNEEIDEQQQLQNEVQQLQDKNLLFQFELNQSVQTYGDLFKIIKDELQKTQFFQNFQFDEDLFQQIEVSIQTIKDHDFDDLDQFQILNQCLIKLQIQYYNQNYNDLADQVDESNQNLQYLQNQVDKQIIQKQQIIGITTTGAAKYKDLINSLEAKIVVIEEAAEILEAHIVSSLTQ